MFNIGKRDKIPVLDIKRNPIPVVEPKKIEAATAYGKTSRMTICDEHLFSNVVTSDDLDEVFSHIILKVMLKHSSLHQLYEYERRLLKGKDFWNLLRKKEYNEVSRFCDELTMLALAWDTFKPYGRGTVVINHYNGTSDTVSSFYPIDVVYLRYNEGLKVFVDTLKRIEVYKRVTSSERPVIYPSRSVYKYLEREIYIKFRADTYGNPKIASLSEKLLSNLKEINERDQKERAKYADNIKS